jgi:hypothetical protein
VEIKVGIQHVAREIVLETPDSPDSIEQALEQALAKDSFFAVTDERGRKVLIPASKIAYVDLGHEGSRHVGFGAL